MEDGHMAGTCLCLLVLVSAGLLIWYVATRNKGKVRATSSVPYLASSPNCHILEARSDKCPTAIDTSSVCPTPDPMSDPIGNVQCWMNKIPQINSNFNPILVMEPFDDGSQPPSGKIYGTNGVYGISTYWFVSGPGNVTDSSDCRHYWGSTADYWSSECRMKSEDATKSGLSELLVRVLTAPAYAAVDGIAWLSYEDTTATMDCIFRCKQPFGRGYFTFNMLRSALGLPMVLNPLG